MAEDTVYIVDDDAASAFSLEALMMSAGFRTEVFRSAEAFLEGSCADRRGCLILDIRLAGMSGLELQKTLVSQGVMLPAIMISGHAEDSVHREALAGGALAVLEKPFAGSQLCKMVGQILR